jgi:hypothetical protein
VREEGELDSRRSGGSRGWCASREWNGGKRREERRGSVGGQRGIERRRGGREQGEHNRIWTVLKRRGWSRGRMGGERRIEKRK